MKDTVYDEYRDIDILFVEMDGYVIELVSPKSQKSIVANLIKAYRNAPYHLCYVSHSFDEELETLEHSGFTKIDKPTPVPALEGKSVCFLFSPQIGLIELIDNKGEK